jgi:hypothetical protein
VKRVPHAHNSSPHHRPTPRELLLASHRGLARGDREGHRDGDHGVEDGVVASRSHQPPHRRRVDSPQRRRIANTPPPGAPSASSTPASPPPPEVSATASIMPQDRADLLARNHFRYHCRSGGSVVPLHRRMVQPAPHPGRPRRTLTRRIRTGLESQAIPTQPATLQPEPANPRWQSLREPGGTLTGGLLPAPGRSDRYAVYPH